MVDGSDATGVAYLVPEFPGQTHAFFWREFSALAELGAGPRLISTRRPREGRARHAFAEPAAALTRYLAPPGPRDLLWLAAHPARALRAVGYLRSLSRATPAARAKRAVILASAARLLRLCRRDNLGHVHIHSCSDAAHLGALCRVMGGPTFGLTLHGDLEVYGTDHGSKMAGAAYVTTVTRPLRQQVIEQVGRDPQTVPVIWMGVDGGRFTPRTADRPDGPVRLLTIARLNRCKGHLHALRALRRALDGGADLCYDIAGDGPAEAEIRAEIKRLNLDAHVRLLGSISEDEVVETLRGGDVFVLPSVGVGEAAPVSVMEAMACGLPIVCSVIGGTPDMLTDGVEGFLITQGDEAALAEAFGTLAGDASQRQAMGVRARERAEAQFDYRVQAARLLEWVQWAMGAGERPAAGSVVDADAPDTAERSGSLRAGAA